MLTLNQLLEAFALPDSCRVDQRVPKKMLIDNGAPTAADKRLLNDAIEGIQWLAALKPNTVGVPEYRDEHRDYLEVAVLCVTVRSPQIAADGGAAVEANKSTVKSANTTRLAELVHRAVPYPALLLLVAPQGVYLSMAHKRGSQNEVGKVILDGDVNTVEATADLASEPQFLQALALTRQPQATLLAVYQGWMDCLTALQAARYTGTFKTADDPVHAAARRDALRECQRLEQESARLRALAVKEKQMAKQVDLNLALKRVQASLAATQQQLRGSP